MGPSAEVLSQVLVCYVSCLGLGVFWGEWGGCIGHVWVEKNAIEINLKVYTYRAVLYFIAQIRKFSEYCMHVDADLKFV